MFFIPTGKKNLQFLPICFYSFVSLLFSLLFELFICQQLYDFHFLRSRPHWAGASSFTRFLDHIQRRNIVSRTPLDEGSTSRRDLYLTTHNTHNRQTSMPPVGFELTVSAGERPQTYILDRAATGTGNLTIFGKF